MNKVLGYERINERVKRPNALINFIKPLEGPDKTLAQDFLERVAAICYPIMKANHIAVMALEEFPPNLEFVGRNFNAGEVIQLVLKAPYTGEWLPFKHVQMVMMHELAHCKQMNHSRAFWKVRNSYADELKVLWGKDYTGEGLWGRGQSLISGRYMTNHMPEAANAPKNLCGGTYRTSGGRKRKRKEDKPKLTYAERQQRRIAKKFGVNGITLGDDENTRVKLESGKGKKPVGKPRVAGSNRGRELRAAAALARFESTKEAVKFEPKSEPTSDDDYETDSDYDDSFDKKSMNPEDGNMVRVCENEDSKDEDAQREMGELYEIDRAISKSQAPQPSRSGKESEPKQNVVIPDDVSTESDDDQDLDNRRIANWASKRRPGQHTSAAPNDVSTASENEIEELTSIPRRVKTQPSSRKLGGIGRGVQKTQDKAITETSKATKQIPVPEKPGDMSTASEEDDDVVHITSKPQGRTKVSKTNQPPHPDPPNSAPQTSKPKTPISKPPTEAQPAFTCPICSLENEPGTAICIACSHVLNTHLMPNSWKCQSLSCRGICYVNPADYGVCGLCGAQKSR